MKGRGFFSAEHFPLWVQRCPVEDVCLPHDHDFMEIALIVAGSGRHCCVQGEQALEAGDVFVLRPGVWHSYVECRGLVVYNCSFSLELLQRDLAVATQDPAINYLFWSGPLSLGRRGLMTFHLSDAAMRECELHLDAMVRLANDPVQGRIERLGHLLLFLSLMARSLGSDHRRAIEYSPRVHAAVEEAVHLLENDPAHEWTLPELASRLHLDKCHVARIFKAGTGLSPMAYLARCRAERAAALLLRSDMPVNDVALQVGWPDPNYFARRFKAHFGLSASQYRAQFSHVAATELSSSTPRVQQAGETAVLLSR
jgi:AraC family L-rhamnose operon transcriptional activator RhaR